ncbi:MAG: hypothetical protein K2K70_04060 [Lachnospiraceae bacterium]|nr:hypothetical protein [Lachnospiraceae bacterium]
MNRNKIYKLLCYLWIVVPILSLIRLSQPLLTIRMSNGVEELPISVRTYNGFQLLVHGDLVNACNTIFIDSKNLGLLMVKVMITLQLVCDIVVVWICLWEWRKKQIPEIHIRIRGILSIGYVLTAIAFYRFLLLCLSHPNASVAAISHAEYYQDELHKNILFSIAVVVLFYATWSFSKAGKTYRRTCYFWIMMPILSLAILSRPMIMIETDDIYPVTDVDYSGFHVLAYGSLANEYKDTVINSGNLGFVIMKIMIALQLVFDVIIVITVLWEWGKKQNPKCLLYFRGGLAAGYLLTALIIGRVAAGWSANLEIEHDLGAFLMRTSYAFGEWGVYMTFELSIAIAILFAVTLLAYCLTSKEKSNAGREWQKTR